MDEPDNWDEEVELPPPAAPQAAPNTVPVVDVAELVDQHLAQPGTLRGEIERLFPRLLAAADEVARLEAERAELQEEKRQLVVVARRLQYRNRDLSGQLQEKKEAFEQALGEIEQARAQTTEARGEVERLRDELQQSRAAEQAEAECARLRPVDQLTLLQREIDVLVRAAVDRQRATANSMPVPILAMSPPGLADDPLPPLPAAAAAAGPITADDVKAARAPRSVQLLELPSLPALVAGLGNLLRYLSCVQYSTISEFFRLFASSPRLPFAPNVPRLQAFFLAHLVLALTPAERPSTTRMAGQIVSVDLASPTHGVEADAVVSEIIEQTNGVDSPDAALRVLGGLFEPGKALSQLLNIDSRSMPAATETSLPVRQGTRFTIRHTATPRLLVVLANGALVFARIPPNVPSHLTLPAGSVAWLAPLATIQTPKPRARGATDANDADDADDDSDRGTTKKMRN